MDMPFQQNLVETPQVTSHVLPKTHWHRPALKKNTRKDLENPRKPQERFRNNSRKSHKTLRKHRKTGLLTHSKPAKNPQNTLLKPGQRHHSWSLRPGPGQRLHRCRPANNSSAEETETVEMGGVLSVFLQRSEVKKMCFFLGFFLVSAWFYCRKNVFFVVLCLFATSSRNNCWRLCWNYLCSFLPKRGWRVLSRVFFQKDPKVSSLFDPSLGERSRLLGISPTKDPQVTLQLSAKCTYIIAKPLQSQDIKTH